VELVVGTPSQGFYCVLDTGSSNLAVSADSTDLAPQTYHASLSSSAVDEGKEFTVRYAVASFTAQRFSDLVAFAPNVLGSVTAEFGAIVASTNFFQKDTEYSGILGVAYPSLASVGMETQAGRRIHAKGGKRRREHAGREGGGKEETARLSRARAPAHCFAAWQPAADPIVPLLERLHAARNLSRVFTVTLCEDQRRLEKSHGYLTLGRLDSTNVLAADPTLASDSRRFAFAAVPADGRNFYSVRVLAIQVGQTTIDVDCSLYNSPIYAIVDTGTTDLIVPEAVHRQIVAQLQKLLSVPGVDPTKFFAVRLCPTWNPIGSLLCCSHFPPCAPCEAH
jgi:hypothetical protein